MGLTEEQIACEEELMEGLLPINIGALLLPPLWGPAHGVMATILFYPAWVFADNSFYAAVTQPSPLSIILACLVGVIILAVTLAFARISQPMAAKRAAARGKTKEQFKREEKAWAIGGVIGAIVIIALATYFNLYLRTPLGA